MTQHELRRYIVEVDGRPHGEVFAASSMDIVIDLLPYMPPAARLSVEPADSWLARSTPPQRAALAERMEAKAASAER